MQNLVFSKYSGCGNDFILVDNRDMSFPSTNHFLISKLCQRQFGIGADGLILLENSDSAAGFRMRIFNSDGSEAEMCGNGIRCLLKFIRQLGFKEQSYTIQTMQRQFKVSFVEDEIIVEMGSPKDIQWNLKLLIDDELKNVHFMDTGVPHAVLFVEDIENVDVPFLGPKIRYHSKFAPKGANVNFVKPISSDSILIRTYERGVEQETLACGTGATASAIAAAKYWGFKSPIKVYLQSKEILKIGFDLDTSPISSVTLTGPARFIFQGVAELIHFS